MKFVFPILLALVTAFSACNKKATVDAPISDLTPPPGLVPGDDGIVQTKVVLDTVTGQPTIAEKPVNAISSMVGPSPKSKIDPVAPVLVKPQPRTPQEERVVRVMTTNYWVINTLIRIKDKPANRQNQGVWFKFNMDGSYEYGYFTQKIGSGTWTFDGQKALLHLDSELFGDDREWSIKMGRDEDLQIWIGTDRYHTTETQLRLYNFIFIPKNRVEIGLTDDNGKVD